MQGCDASVRAHPSLPEQCSGSEKRAEEFAVGLTGMKSSGRYSGLLERCLSVTARSLSPQRRDACARVVRALGRRSSTDPNTIAAKKKKKERKEKKERKRMYKPEPDARSTQGDRNPSMCSADYCDYLPRASSARVELDSHPGGSNIWKDFAVGCDFFQGAECNR